MIFCANFVGTLFINIFQPSFNLFPALRVWRGTNSGPSLNINLATLARGEILRNIGPALLRPGCYRLGREQFRSRLKIKTFLLFNFEDGGSKKMSDFVSEVL